jgi:hypothetical protein
VRTKRSPLSHSEIQDSVSTAKFELPHGSIDDGAGRLGGQACSDVGIFIESSSLCDVGHMPERCGADAWVREEAVLGAGILRGEVALSISALMARGLLQVEVANGEALR